MPNKFVGAFKFFTKGSKKGKVAPTITQPRQLKKTMEGIRSKYKKFAFTEAKTAKDRANIVRTKKSIERMNKLQKAQDKRKEGIKASKEVKKMIGTGQADRVGSSVYHRGIRDKKAEGGILGRAKKFLGKEAPKRKPKSEAEINKIVNSDAYKKADYKGKTKMLGGQVFTRKEMEEKIKKGKPSIKDKILPPKKKNRLQELREELNKMKKGGKVKKKFPDLTGDGKVTQADILKGRGVFGAGGGVRGSTKGSDIYSRLKQKDRLKKIRKMFKGKK